MWIKNIVRCVKLLIGDVFPAPGAKIFGHSSSFQVVDVHFIPCNTKDNNLLGADFYRPKAKIDNAKRRGR